MSAADPVAVVAEALHWYARNPIADVSVSEVIVASLRTAGLLVSADSDQPPRCQSIFPPSADAPHDGPGWSAPLRCVLSPHDHDRHLNSGIYWGGGMPEQPVGNDPTEQQEGDEYRRTYGRDADHSRAIEIARSSKADNAPEGQAQ